MLDGKALLYLVWGVSIAGLFLFIPRDKVHLAWLAFLFEQVLTWPLGLVVADRGWVQYPINPFFVHATRISFTYEYFFLPVVCACFMVFFPNEKRLAVRAAYYIVFCTILTLMELLALQYTNLIRYIHWNAGLTWIMIFITFFITRRFCVWFFRSYSKVS